MAMARMTFTVPEELKARVQARKDTNWSGFVAMALQDRLERLERLDQLDRLAPGSDVTDEDIEEMSAMIKKAVGRRFRADMEQIRLERASSSTQTD